MASAKREPIGLLGVLGLCPQRSPGVEPPEAVGFLSVQHPTGIDPQTGGGGVKKSPFEIAAKRLKIDHMCQ